MDNAKLASMIDHTLLKPGVTGGDLKKICDEAKKYNFATVCVMPENVAFVAGELKGSAVKPISVVDFPKGVGSPGQKADETRKAIADGAREIDMVIDYNALNKKDYRLAYEGISAVIEAAKGVPVKVILEIGALTDDEKIAGCVLSKAAGAAFVKTSTGFGPGGATVGDVALMKRIIGPDMGVKASGGIRTREDAEKMIAAGANRIGTSSGVAIVGEL